MVVNFHGDQIFMDFVKFLIHKGLIICMVFKAMRINAYTTPANDTDYSCHIKATELTYSIIWGLYHTTSRH